MKEVYPKWIVEQGKSLEVYFVIGKVTFHKDLRMSRKCEVLGGGYFSLDWKNKIVYLYGKSEDFGSVSILNIKLALQTDISSMELSEPEWKYKYAPGYESYSNLTDEQIKEIKWVDIER